MKAVVVTCPHCGARLQVVGTAVSVQCEYCGTASRVQRRTMMLERVIPPPQQGPRPVAIQVHTSRWRWLLVSTFALPIAITGIVVWQVTRTVSRAMDFAGSAPSRSSPASARASSSSSTSRAQPPDAPSWQSSDGAIVADVDGNGTLELIGRTRRVQAGDTVRVIALDGATGKAVWESEPLGTYGQTSQGVLALAGDRLVFASQRAELTALALATGQRLWQAKLDERVARFCDGGAGTVLAVGTDGVARTVRLADGGLAGTVEPPPARPRGRRPPPCPALPNDGRADHDARRHDLGRKHGLSSATTVAGPGGRVLFGTRAQGTRVAMLVGLDDAGDAARWKIAVAQDPLAAVEREPIAVAVADLEVCAAYYGSSIVKPARLACFALADGARLWDLELEDRSLRGVRALGGLLVALSFGAVHAYDLETGAARWRFGD